MTRFENFIFNLFLNEEVAIQLKEINTMMFDGDLLVEQFKKILEEKEYLYETKEEYSIKNFLNEITEEWLQLTQSTNDKAEKNMLEIYFFSYYYKVVLRYINRALDKQEKYITKQDLSWFSYITEEQIAI